MNRILRNLWQERRTRGILWMLMSCFGAAVMMAMVRHLSESLPSTTIVFYRNVAALLCFLPWLIYTKGSYIRTSRWKMYGLRGLLGMIAMQLWFYSLSVVELPLAVALSFTSPLITAGLAIMLFKEKGGIAVWGALGAGFLGALVILRPGLDSFNPNAIWVMVTAIIWSTSGIIIKSLARTDSPVTIVCFMGLVMTPLSLPVALLDWHWVTDPSLLIWLFALGVVSNLFQIAMSYAIATTDLVHILPFDFSRLVFVSLIAWPAFGEVLDPVTLLGAVIILTAAVVASRLESRRAKRMIKEAERV